MSDHLLTFLTSVVFAGLLVLLAAVGWRARRRRQGGVPAPSAFPSDPGNERFRAEGQYVTTTSAGDWLDRIAVHGLGLRTRADAVVCDGGVLFDRAGSGPLWVPARDLVEVRLGSGMAGKFVERDGLVVLEWHLGDKAVDTGFRTRRPEDKAALVAAIEDLMGAGRRDGSSPAEQEEE
ncbi:hypothetical protein [Sinomonas susongensis]|uniref:PH-like domain-containing protein n=1 Tax=Sinomonas susongensis TaxID=1324851 RepID=UPI001109C30B|nr:hypothetical protein [Sinomonas susongensis]